MLSKELRSLKRKVIELAQEAVFYVVLVITVIQLIFPQVVLAEQRIKVILSGDQYIIKNVIDDPDWNYSIRLPDIKERAPRQSVKITVTAYTSQIAQTDNSPCITASGLDVCQRNAEDIIATNYRYLPFGTLVRFPDLFGDKIFQVHDRMNKRYQQHADVWMKDYEMAIKFGRKQTKMEIYF
ncbi:MAG: hypothetical protein COX77_02740 [Candidatus Komeilibacteria bacterium CG_4_10_14_0_2_um_filter_37_10]|uniref:3D domain-containing protein n=1 Tax=Candidatus Komeilibacteria bacterium CG_4_10_14_0_2_um_filter_37_10 TaxID=1974470 RepID=A0A2M7VEQ3_9BACT|nr:MAG: hypothetical protein COX77_02740 [Candidatus Komeilibacteria bacterium CG_4_10_14_0_2_um_filter_37_10]